jgi:hypothetical protein
MEHVKTYIHFIHAAKIIVMYRSKQAKYLQSEN